MSAVPVIVMPQASPDDLMRGAMALKDEASMLEQVLVPASNPQSYGYKGLRDRSQSLKRCAAFLEHHAGVVGGAGHA